MRAGQFYEIYNKSNGHEPLFLSPENYRYFLKKFNDHLNNVATLYSFCLLPNFFHFILKINEEHEIEKSYGKFISYHQLEYRISKQFSNFFSCYTQSFNKLHHRKGSLFTPNFRRSLIESNCILKETIHFVHSLPVIHGLADKMEAWNFNGINSFVRKTINGKVREEIMEIFGGEEVFWKVHEKPMEENSYFIGPERFWKHL